jgi:hypothetical protein
MILQDKQQKRISKGCVKTSVNTYDKDGRKYTDFWHNNLPPPIFSELHKPTIK